MKKIYMILKDQKETGVFFLSENNAKTFCELKNYLYENSFSIKQEESFETAKEYLIATENARQENENLLSYAMEIISRDIKSYEMGARPLKVNIDGFNYMLNYNTIQNIVKLKKVLKSYIPLASVYKDDKNQEKVVNECLNYDMSYKDKKNLLQLYKIEFEQFKNKQEENQEFEDDEYIK